MAILLFKWSILVHWLLAGYTGQVPAEGQLSDHPLYITVTEINYNAEDKNLEISCKIFTDDFENALRIMHRTKIDLTNPPDPALANKQVYEYIRANLQIKLDGQPVSLEYVGYEKETDATWAYLQVGNIAQAPKVIEIRNSLLHDAFEEQINLMHVSVGGKRKSGRLNYPNKDAKFEF
jgi:disulfide oxidoreductase YuzD